MVDTLENQKNIVAASPKIKHAYLRHTVWWAGMKLNWSYLKFQRTMNLKKKRIIDNEKIEVSISENVNVEIVKSTGIQGLINKTDQKK